MTVDVVRVGQFPIELATAVDWVRAYTDAESNRTARKPFAYPAYDCFGRDSNHPGTLTDGDLLAPMLLNVGISIRSYYGLQLVRSQLESVLADDELAKDLAKLSDDTIMATAAGIYKVLDEESAPFGIQGTTLSKIVHRKRPASLPLHDIWVRTCYVGHDAPVPLVPKGQKRTWAEYMGLISVAIAEDLRSQEDAFHQLQAQSLATAPPLTDLRLLDILAWNRGQSD